VTNINDVVRGNDYARIHIAFRYYKPMLFYEWLSTGWWFKKW